ncbi:MAG: ABC transporter permease [Propionicimonas sp.]|uniref:ABC transporter permease n=1 Tax=Propionicimonas sp. TaxID=1955623 RepID=UPI002B21DB8B|nr:ABC transporter permease [Propionicimonas sp.]MEA4943775.1 ABC transporter permease [Propionicimonas sp.]MEA5117342.1 ABC transporter permease [Propionicimonas sp.]
MTTTTAAKVSRFDLGSFTKKYAIVGILLLIVITLSIMTSGTFLRPQNLINVIVQVSAIGIIATGMTFVIIIEGIDLSVGSVIAMSAVISASLAQLPSASNLMYPGLNLPLIVPVLAGLGVGALAGAINGFLITQFRIAPFIATLGMMTAGSGIASIYTNGRPVSTLTPEFNFLGQGAILGIPVPIVIFAVVAVLGHLVLNFTRFGRHAYALGGNVQAARVSGININRLKFTIFTATGLLAGLAGLILAGRIGSGQPTLGTGIELDVIAATVIGGTSFTGGVGTIWGTVVGALIIGTINNGLDLMNVSPFWQKVVKGAIIVTAIIIDELKNRSK